MENRNTIGVKGDAYMVPLNMSVLGDDGMPMPVVEKAPSEPNTPARGMRMSLMEPLVLDAAERIGKRELNEFTAARQKHKTAEKFALWAEQFYKRDYPTFIKTVAKPFVEADFLKWEQIERGIEIYCDTRGALALNDDLAVFVTDEIVKLFEEAGDGQE
jgi:hypothetical protein